VLGAALACAALALPAGASAAEQQALQEYHYVVDRDDASLLAQQGVELDHAGFDSERKGVQRVIAALYPSQVAALERQGLEPSRVVIQQAQAKPETGGDSPSPYYDVFRSYSEPGGIADEMRRLAADNRDVMKLVQIGTSMLGKPILAIKMTADARNVPDGTRKAVLYSAVNHAREWIAAEVGRRMPRWFAEHKTDPQIQRMLQSAELWFLPVQNPDGYDYTFTCGRGAENRLCGHGGSDVNGNALGTQLPSNRLWRKTLRDNNGNGIFGDAITVNGRTSATAWTRTATTRRRGTSTRRARATTPRPRSTAARIRFPSPRTSPTTGCCASSRRRAHQLPLGGAAAAVSVRLHHRRLRRRQPVVRGPDRHGRRRGGRPVHPAAVLGPLRDQRRDHRSRVQQVRHDVVDARSSTRARRRRRPWCATTNPQTNNSGLLLPGRREQGPSRLREEPRLRAQRGGHARLG
jgi:hypothetical protein